MRFINLVKLYCLEHYNEILLEKLKSLLKQIIVFEVNSFNQQ